MGDVADLIAQADAARTASWGCAEADEVPALAGVPADSARRGLPALQQSSLEDEGVRFLIKGAPHPLTLAVHAHHWRKDLAGHWPCFVSYVAIGPTGRSVTRAGHDNDHDIRQVSAERHEPVGPRGRDYVGPQVTTPDTTAAALPPALPRAGGSLCNPLGGGGRVGAVRCSRAMGCSGRGVTR